MRAAEFVAKWETRLKQVEHLHAQVDGAVLCREVLQDFAEVRAADEEELLSLADAAAISGYTRDHLSRLIRDCKIPNAGRRGVPRVRRRDLPRRPRTAVAQSENGGYDLTADARKLVSRRRGGENGPS